MQREHPFIEDPALPVLDEHSRNKQGRRMPAL
jgi:hypothetical protein